MSGTVNETATWWAETHANDSDVLVAYFSMEFARRHAARDLLGWPRRPRRRPSEGGGRARRPARRGRPLLPGRLLRAGRLGRRAPDGALPGARSGGGRACPRAGRRRGRPRRRGRQRRGLAVRRRHGAAVPARRALGDGRAVRGEPRAPDPPGAPPRRRRHPSAARARDHADRVPRQRRPLGLPHDRARPRPRRRQERHRTTRSRRFAARPCSRRTRRCRPGTRCSTTTSCSATSATWRATPASPTTGCSTSGAAPTPTASA